MAILADAGLPMIFLELPAMLLGLIPVVVAEYVVARKMLNLTPMSASKALVAANLASTLVGFPLVWGLLLAVQLGVGGGSAYGLRTFWTRAYAVTVQAPWLIPYEQDLKWMIPIAALYLLIPAFFASVYVERWICLRFWPDQERARIRRFSWIAHFVSYAVLIVLAAIYYGTVFKRG
jgi:hypothetical protein